MSEKKYSSYTVKRRLIAKAEKSKDNKIICFYCGYIFEDTLSDYDSITVEHKLPQNKYVDYTNKFDNLELCCKRCNSSRGNTELFKLDDNNNIVPIEPAFSEFKRTRKIDLEINREWIVKGMLKAREFQLEKIRDEEEVLIAIYQRISRDSRFTNVKKFTECIRFCYFKNEWKFYPYDFRLELLSSHVSKNNKDLVAMGFNYTNNCWIEYFVEDEDIFDEILKVLNSVSLLF